MCRGSVVRGSLRRMYVFVSGKVEENLGGCVGVEVIGVLGTYCRGFFVIFVVFFRGFDGWGVRAF